MPTFTHNDLPAMYCSADNASVRDQRRFIRWNRINIVVLIAAAVVSAFKEPLHVAGAIIGAALLFFGAGLTFWLRKSRLERHWYSSRAIAESVKTLAWRYMMRAAPFEGGSVAADSAADHRFLELIHQIAKQESAAPAPGLNEITAGMQAVRAQTSSERAALYLAARIEDQRVWYTRSSQKNERRGARMLFVAAAAQIVACIFALYQIYGTTPDFIGIFATVSAGALAWMQLKRYEDLAQAYHTAAVELSRIGLDFRDPIDSDDRLSRLVIDSENAISREHTLWLAKRVDEPRPV